MVIPSQKRVYPDGEHHRIGGAQYVDVDVHREQGRVPPHHDGSECVDAVRERIRVADSQQPLRHVRQQKERPVQEEDRQVDERLDKTEPLETLHQAGKRQADGDQEHDRQRLYKDGKIRICTDQEGRREDYNALQHYIGADAEHLPKKDGSCFPR